MTKRKNSHAWCARGPHCRTHEAQQCDIHRWLHCAGHRHWLRNKVDKMISWEKTCSKVKLWLEIWCSFQKIIQNRHRSSQWRLVDICSRRNKHERLHNVFDWKNRIPPFTTVMFFSFASRGSFSLQELVPLNAAQDTRRLGCAMTGWNTHLSSECLHVRTPCILIGCQEPCVHKKIKNFWSYSRTPWKLYRQTQEPWLWKNMLQSTFMHMKHKNHE